MWRKRITTSKHSVNLVEKSLHSTARILPSESIYYGIYPYRLKLDVTAFQIDEMPQWRKNFFTYDILNLQIACHLPKEKQRFRGNYARSPNSDNVYTLYVQDIDFVREVCRLFDKHVIEISGPTTKEYLNLLYSPNKFVSVREKNWYGKWETAYTFWIPFGSHNYMARSKRYIMYDQVKDTIRDLLPEDEYQFSTSKWIVKLFTNSESGKDLIPWIILQYPDLEIREYLCIEIDK